MAEEEKKVEEGGATETDGAEARRTPVAFSGKRVPTSYANAFQTRIMDGMIAVTYGVSYPEPVRERDALVVDMDRRVVMTPDAAGRLVQALVRLLRPVAPGEQSQAGGGEAGDEGSREETETFGQN